MARQACHIAHVHHDDGGGGDDDDMPAVLDRQEVLDLPLLLVVGVGVPHDLLAEIRRYRALPEWVHLS